MLAFLLTEHFKIELKKKTTTTKSKKTKQTKTKKKKTTKKQNKNNVNKQRMGSCLHIILFISYRKCDLLIGLNIYRLEFDPEVTKETHAMDHCWYWTMFIKIFSFAIYAIYMPLIKNFCQTTSSIS